MGIVAELLNPPARASYGPADDFWYNPVGGETVAGVTVTADAAMRVSAVNACVARYANTVAQSPWIVYRKLANGGKERAPENAAFQLLHEDPGYGRTPSQLKQLLTGLAILRGNAYARIVPGERGPFSGLRPMHPDLVTPERLPNGARRWKVRDPEKATEETLVEGEVFHLTGLHNDGIKGIGFLEYARDSIGEAIAQTTYSGRMLQQGPSMRGVVTHPGHLSDPAFKRLQDSVNAKSGPQNAGKTLFLEEGVTWTNIGMTNEAMQYIETRQLSRIEIAQFANMPLVMIQEQSKDTSWGTGVEQQMIGFIVFTMMPVFVNFEERADSDLLLDRRNFSTEFLVDGLLRGDAKSRYEVYQIALNMRIMNPNEVRLRENLNPYPGGNEFLTTPNNSAGTQPAPRQAFDPRAQLLGREMSRQLAKKETLAIEKHARKYADDGAGWEAWAREFYVDVASELTDRFSVEPTAAQRYAAQQRDDLILRGAGVAEAGESARAEALLKLILEG